MSLLTPTRCNPYEPTFLACSGAETPVRWYPYGPGDLVLYEPPVVPFVVQAPEVEAPRLPAFRGRLDDELTVGTTQTVGAEPGASVPEPAMGVLVLLVAVALCARRRAR